MKKILLLILISFLPFTGLFAKGAYDSKSRAQISAVINDYSSDPDIEIIQIGSLGTSLLKTMVKWGSAGDQDLKDALALMKNIKSVTIVDYSSCKQSVKDGFNSKIQKYISQDNLLMEAKDGSDVVRFYATTDEDGKTLKDLMVYCPGDDTLITLFGSISMDAVAKLTSESR